MFRRYQIYGALLALVLIAYALTGNDYSIVNYPPKNETIVAFGDSLIEGRGATDGNGLVPRLSRKLSRPIVNFGVSGNTSGEGLRRLNEVLANDPGTVIILFGGNDYLHKVSKDLTFHNLREMIATIQSRGSMVILLGIRGGLVSDPYAPLFQELARETGCVYVPDVLDGLYGDSRYMSDAVHPNDIGYAKMTDKVYEVIKKWL